jgi:serine O-acetyltransferase
MKFDELISLLKADLMRITTTATSRPQYFNWLSIFNPRFWPVLIIRIARFISFIPGLKLLTPILTWLNVIIFGIEFTAKCKVGPGLMLPHTVGTVVGAREIGANVTIYQGVTIGAKFVDLQFDESKRPTIEDDVAIGAGSKVLGGITIGSGSKIAPNAVVFEDVPANAIAIGNPAKIQAAIKSRKDE